MLGRGKQLRAIGFVAFAALLAVPLGATSANAVGPVTRTWLGGNGPWSAALGWSPAGVPQDGDSLIFGVYGGVDVTVDDIPGLEIASLTSIDGADITPADGVTLTVTGNVTGPTNLTFLPLVLPAGQHELATETGTIFLGDVSGAGGITVTGQQSVLFTSQAVVSYTGATIVEGGTLDAYSLPMTSSITVRSGLRLRSDTIDRPIMLDGGATCDDEAVVRFGSGDVDSPISVSGAASIWSDDDLSLNGTISGDTDCLRLAPTGTLKIKGDNTYSGLTLIDAATVAPKTSTAFGTSLVSLTSGALTLADGIRLENRIEAIPSFPSSAAIKLTSGTAELRGGVVSKFTGSFTPVVITLGPTATLVVKGGLHGKGGLRKTGKGILVLTGGTASTRSGSPNANPFEIASGIVIVDGVPGRAVLPAKTSVSGSAALAFLANDQASHTTGIVSTHDDVSRILLLGTTQTFHAYSGAGLMSIGMPRTADTKLNGGVLNVPSYRPNGVTAFVVGGTTAGVNLDQIRARSVDLRSTFPVFLWGPNLPVGISAKIVNNRGGGSTKPFEGLPEGTEFTEAGRNWRITYKGGDGNDVVLRRIGANEFTARFSAQEYSDLQRAAAYFRIPVNELPKTGVAALAYILGASGVSSQSITAPANNGPKPVSTKWRSADMPILRKVTGTWSVNGGQAHLIGGQFMILAWKLSGSQ